MMGMLLLLVLLAQARMPVDDSPTAFACISSYFEPGPLLIE